MAFHHVIPFTYLCIGGNCAYGVCFGVYGSPPTLCVFLLGAPHSGGAQMSGKSVKFGLYGPDLRNAEGVMPVQRWKAWMKAADSAYPKRWAMVSICNAELRNRCCAFSARI